MRTMKDSSLRCWRVSALLLVSLLMSGCVPTHTISTDDIAGTWSNRSGGLSTIELSADGSATVSNLLTATVEPIDGEGTWELDTSSNPIVRISLNEGGGADNVGGFTMSVRQSWFETLLVTYVGDPDSSGSLREYRRE